MTANALGLLGLARKAGKLELGEDPVGAACRGRQARLVLLACDAAENTADKAHRLAQTSNARCVRIPFTKEELGAALGRGSCAMAAVTDVRLAQAVAAKLAEQDPQRYQEAEQRLRRKAERAAERTALRQSGKRRSGRKKSKHEKKA